MNIERRDFVIASIATAVGVLTATNGSAAASAIANQGAGMYGLIGKMTAKPGQRDALAAILLEGLQDMPGCLSYIVASDPTDADALWITEVWDRKESHDASLSLAPVKAAIGRGRPMIAGFGPSTVTTPIGGHGLVGLHGTTRGEPRPRSGLSATATGALRSRPRSTAARDRASPARTASVRPALRRSDGSAA